MGERSKQGARSTQTLEQRRFLRRNEEAPGLVGINPTYAKTSVTKKEAIMLSTTHILDLMLRNMSD